MQVLNQAVGALDRVRSFSVQAAGTQLDGARVTLNGEFELPGKMAVALTQGAETARVVVVNQYAYLRANRAFLLANAPSGARLAGKWVRLPATAPGVAEFYAETNPRTLGRCLLEAHLGTLSLAGTATVRGRRAVVLVDHGNFPGSEPGKLWVATDGSSLPLQAMQLGPQRPGGGPNPACGQAGPQQSATSRSITIIDRYNQPVSIAAPSGAINLASPSTTSPTA